MLSLLPLGSAAFLLFGVVLVVLGACQPGVVASLGLSEAEWGLLGGCLALGIGAGVLVAGPLVDRFPRRPIFLTSTLATGVALVSVADGMSTGRAMLHVFMVGAGVGVYDTLLNTVTVERWRERSVRPLGLLHAAVTVGAVATPPLVALAGGASAWVPIFRAIGMAYFALSLWVALAPLPPPSRSFVSNTRLAEQVTYFARPAFVALCLVGLAYVGVEAALTLFAIPYAEGALGLDTLRGSRAISAFWFGILLGRFAMMLPADSLGPFAPLVRLDARVIAAAGLCSALAIGAGAALRLPQVELLLGACGLALSCVFPMMIALAGQTVPEARGSATGIVAGMGSVGGFALPWLTGALAGVSGVGVAIASLSLWCGAIALAALAAHLAERAGRASHATRMAAAPEQPSSPAPRPADTHR